MNYPRDFNVGHTEAHKKHNKVNKIYVTFQPFSYFFLHPPSNTSEQPIFLSSAAKRNYSKSIVIDILFW